MKIVFLTNNNNTLPLFQFLKNTAKEEVILWSNKFTLSQAKNINPEIVISYNYKLIIDEDVINYLKPKIINLHISYLPWNRGMHPNVWSFLENTPKGVTIHLINKGVDTGDILLQRKIEMDELRETLASSYERLHKEIQELFIRNWSRIKSFEIDPRPQSNYSNLHYNSDFEKIKYILGREGWEIPIFLLKQRYNEITDQ